jgi:hypothetical protein
MSYTNKFPVIFLDEEIIIEYLKKYGHGVDSKDHELAIAIWVKRLFETNTGNEHCIAFELQHEVSKSIPEIEVIAKYRREDTQIDFLLVKGRASIHEVTGWGFQLKRFGRGIKKNFIEELISFIKAKSLIDADEVGLIVILDLDPDLEPTELESFKERIPAKLFADKIKMDERSYKKVILLSRGENILQFTEVFPTLKQIEMIIR